MFTPLRRQTVSRSRFGLLIDQSFTHLSSTRPLCSNNAVNFEGCSYLVLGIDWYDCMLRVKDFPFSRFSFFMARECFPSFRFPLFRFPFFRFLFFRFVSFLQLGVGKKGNGKKGLIYLSSSSCSEFKLTFLHHCKGRASKRREENGKENRKWGRKDKKNTNWDNKGRRERGKWEKEKSGKGIETDQEMEDEGREGEDYVILQAKYITKHQEDFWYKSSAVAEMGDRLATIDMSRNVGLLCPFPWGGGVGSPSNTMSLGPRSTSVPSGILIHPAWPQYTNVKYRQTGQRSRCSRSIGRTVSWNGRPKMCTHGTASLTAIVTVKCYKRSPTFDVINITSTVAVFKPLITRDEKSQEWHSLSYGERTYVTLDIVVDNPKWMSVWVLS